MKFMQPQGTADAAAQRQSPAATREQSVRTAGAQAADASPLIASQREKLAQWQPAAPAGAVQLKNGNGGGKGGGGGGDKKPQVSEKEKRKRLQQSRDARHANAAVAYSGDAAKHQSKNLTNKEMLEINKNVKGHASRDGGSKQNSATTKSQAAAKEATEKKIAEKKQQEKERANKRVNDWKKDFHTDKKDRGGAGGGIGVRVK